MGFNDVSFKTENGNMEGVAEEVNLVCGLILGGVETDDLKFNTAKQIYSLDDLKDLGITETYDTTNKSNFYNEVSDFYLKAPVGTPLWICLVSSTTLMKDVFDYSKDIAKKFIIAAKGEIQLLGANIKRADDYTAVIEDGADKDIYDAMLNAHELANKMAEMHMPFRTILPCRAYTGTLADLKDLSTCTNNRVALSLWGSSVDKEAKIGIVLGKKAFGTLQQNIGRVADGDMGVSEAYLTDNTEVDALITQYDTIANKRYIFPVKRFGRNGYYINSDPMACDVEDDFHRLSHGLVLDQVQRLAYDVFLEFINDDYAVDASGQISPVELKRLQGNIEKRINAELTSKLIISGFKAYVPSNQDTLSSGKTMVRLKIQPKAYHDFIEVTQAFTKTL